MGHNRKQGNTTDCRAKQLVPTLVPLMAQFNMEQLILKVYPMICFLNRDITPNKKEEELLGELAEESPHAWLKGIKEPSYFRWLFIAVVLRFTVKSISAVVRPKEREVHPVFLFKISAGYPLCVALEPVKNRKPGTTSRYSVTKWKERKLL